MSTAPASGPRDDGDRGPETRPGTTPSASGPEAVSKPLPKPRAKVVFDDPLDQQSADETDRGWGEQASSGGSAADLARFLDEKPPHHI
ncbi:hypothetical protein [Streptomyces sp. NBC_00388]|uniref:hypothetical protein n=1 Tax=Streptomyces sp. NBC_00388 TaxID=2975735 RepID=UPI002E21EFBD